MKILIVEDETTDRLMLRSAVQHLGHECLVAASGAAGWEMFGLHQPDVVLSDWRMPGMDGVELCRRIRAGEWSTYTPFIFVTGLTDKEHALAGMEVGADDYLTKPLDVNELRARLMAAARLKRAEGRVIEHTAALETAIRNLETEAGERIRAEQALRASEERFRNQYKGFPLPTYSWLQIDDDFVLQDYNDAAEASTEGLIRDWRGKRVSEGFMDDAHLPADLQACVAEQHTLRREKHHRFWRSGPARDLAITFVFVPPQTVMVHIEDITEAKRAEQQREAMAQSEKLRALGTMATGIAHDLNQSLMLVASYSELARQALVEVPLNVMELDNLLSTTTQAALDGGESVKRLLLFTRAPTEHAGEAVDLTSVVGDAARLTAPRWRDASQAEGRPISLHIEAGGQTIIHGTPGRLRELMTNLIFNAVDALPKGGTIRLRVVTEGDQGIIEITDSGVGMSAEVQAHIFEPFFTTKGESGTGLGLAMAFGIVKQHGGHIEVRSMPGDGTTVRMYLPLMATAPSIGAKPARVAPARSDTPRPLRVLSVDDEPMMTRAVVRMLKPAGHVVSVAASGEEALEKLAAQPFDVVVSDMGMGAGMNGWELADAVRRRWPSVRFLLATGWGATMDPGEARIRGVEAVLSKPYHPADLLRALADTPRAA
jgi:DNA-binding response OmpR family regulator/nitrogen-specific signal transduction histidine kinase